MKYWKKPFKYFRRFVTTPFRGIKLITKQLLGFMGVPIILPFTGFGTSRYIVLKGLLIEDKGLTKTDSKQNIFKNLIAMIKRYIGDEIPGIRLKITFNDQYRHVITDEKGQYELHFHLKDELKTSNPWHKVHVEVDDDVIEHHGRIKATGEVFIQNGTSEFGIISDVDDTVLISHSTEALKKLHLLLFHNAKTRKPFPGIASFYTALHYGTTTGATNPLFFVSSSEWNLYDLLDDFCNTNHFPKRIFMLKELRASLLQFLKSGGGNHFHKMSKIRMIMDTYPEMSFILFGDSGQKDPEVYYRIANEYPERIKAIYIRAVHKGGIERKKLLEYKKEFKGMGIDMIFVEDTYEAVIHAIKNNFILEEKLQEIMSDRYEDEHVPTIARKIFEEVTIGDKEED